MNFDEMKTKELSMVLGITEEQVVEYLSKKEKEEIKQQEREKKKQEKENEKLEKQEARKAKRELKEQEKLEKQAIREEKRRERESNREPKFKDLHEILLGILKGNFGEFPEFENKYLYTRISQENFLYKKNNELNIVEQVPNDSLLLDLNSYCHKLGNPFSTIGLDKLNIIVQNYIAFYVNENKLDIKPFRLKSDEGLCLKRLEWDYTPCTNLDCAPAFKEFISRCSNREALCIFIGSLFFDDSDRSQYVWLYGDGANGKSTFVSCVSDIFGNSVGYYDPVVDKDFCFKSFFMKRLVVTNDTNNYTFVQSGLIKSITGGDFVTLQEKFKPSISFKPNCKIIATSNEIPMLNNEADFRRIIFCEVEALPYTTERLTNYGEILKAETIFWASYCIDRYKDQIAKNGKKTIPVDLIDKKDLAREHNSDIFDILERHFVVSGGDKMYRNSQKNDDFLEIFELENILKNFNREKNEPFQRFKKRFLSIAYQLGAVKIRRSANGQRSTIISGLSRKDSAN